MATRTLLATALSLILVQQPSLCETPIGEAALPHGSYAITTRLELPHLERWAIDTTTKVCLTGSLATSQIPIPILSANNPYAKCAAGNFIIDNGRVEYDIVCPGRDAAKAHATYLFGTDRFAGRVAMVLGGKNMTMTEVQHARRIGDCSPASREAGTAF
jgi:hypothetical protein